MVLWVLVSVFGALNHTIITKIRGAPFPLPLPHLYSGHVMFVRIPRDPTVHYYQSHDGTWRPLYELTEAHGWLYERARLEANLSFSPSLLADICRRHLARTGGVTHILREEHRLSKGAPQPVKRLYFRCDATGLTPVRRT
ncbi:MAG: hypothetical protein ACO3JL_07520 [Myxococcota bacterium]